MHFLRPPLEFLFATDCADETTPPMPIPSRPPAKILHAHTLMRRPFGRFVHTVTRSINKVRTLALTSSPPPCATQRQSTPEHGLVEIARGRRFSPVSLPAGQISAWPFSIRRVRRSAS